jgi:pimeloyl-ACP methyl ester carboxylesterase
MGRFRLVPFDLRGHVLSDAPESPEAYAEPQLWADDIAAIIKQLNLRQPSDSALRALERPVLMTHGLSDIVVLPAMGKLILDTCHTCSASWYPEVGHVPFLEEPMRFNRELTDFVREALISW